MADDYCRPSSVPITDLPRCVPDSSAQKPAWRESRDEFSPFINPRNCRYSIVVDRCYVNVDRPSAGITTFKAPGSSPNDRLDRYVAYGVDKLIQFYNKKLSGSDITRQQLINAATSEWHVAARQDMKVLVSLPYNLFHDIPQREYAPSYSESSKKIVKYDVRLLRSKIEYVSKVMREQYGRERHLSPPFGDTAGHGRVGTAVRNFKFKDEADEMDLFITYLQEFLTLNQIDIDLGQVATNRQEFIEFIIEPPIHDLKPNEKNELLDERKSVQERIDKDEYLSDVNDFGSRVDRWFDAGFRAGPGKTVTSLRREDEADAREDKARDQSRLQEIDERVALIESKENIAYTILDIRYTFKDEEKKYLKIGPPPDRRSSQRTTALVYWTGAELFDYLNGTAPGPEEETGYNPLEGPPPTMPDMATATCEGGYQQATESGTPTWKTFIDKYIYPPINTSPEIGWVSDALHELQEFESALASTLGWANYGMGIVNGSQSPMPLVDNYLKSQSDLFGENDNIFNRTMQTNLLNQQGGIVRGSDDNVVQAAAARAALSVMGNLEDLYQNLLSHVDLKYLVAKLAACLGLEPSLIPCQVLELIREVARLLLVLVNMDLSSIRFPDDPLAVLGDITEDLVNYILQFLLNLVNLFITETYLALLLELDSLCEESFDYGAVDLSGLIDDSFSSPEQANSFFGGLDSNLGNCEPGTVQEMIRDISAALTTSQFCSLIRGSASSGTLKRVHRVVMLDKYSCLHQRFSTMKKIGDFFASMSGLVDLSFCDVAAGISDFDRLCDSGFNEADRRAAYQNLDDITPEQIEQQLAAERNRRLELLADVTKIIDSNEDTLTNNLINALRDPSGPASSVAQHPSTGDAVQQMITTVFHNPAITLINEGAGNLNTPYTTVEYMSSTDAGIPILRSEELATNKGIMKIISDNDEHYFYKFGKTSGFPGTKLMNNELGDGVADQLSWINLNLTTIPRPSSGLATTINKGSSRWEYKTKLYPKVGGFSDSKISGDRSFISYQVQYSAAERRQIPSWWEVDDGHHMDAPRIRALFIKRDPFVGVLPGEKVDINPDPAVTNEVRIDLPGPALKHFVQRERTLMELGHQRYITHHKADPISIFNDLPKVIEEGLVPKYDELIVEPAGTKQQTTYANLIAKSLKGFSDKYAESPIGIPNSNTLVDGYQCTFNDVMRILYRFVTDSEFYPDYATEDMLVGLKDMFSDSEKLMDLLGISSDLEQIIQEGIASTLVNESSQSDASKNIIGEAALRFMIRIYILEIYLKNIYMLTSVPENRGDLGKVIDPTNSEPLKVSNPFTGTRAKKSKFYGKMLDLADTIDPVIVSYIAEYISFSDSRVEGDCAAFYDIAYELAEKALNDESPEDGFLSIDGPDEVLAYYPPRDYRDRQERSRPAALKYYIAKELKMFVETLQGQIQLKKLRPDISTNMGKRTLMKSFLDKFDIVGYNVEGAQSILGRWSVLGEGLYMQFYYREAPTSEEYFFDELNYLDEPFGEDRPNKNLANSNRIGLRICLRDSVYHPADLLEFGPGEPRGIKFNDIAGQYNLFAAGAFSDDPAVNSPRSWTSEMGFPVLEYETTWGEIKSATGITTNKAYLNEKIVDRRKIVNHLKDKLTQTDDFRVMFEYVFPVRKMFNLLFIMMDQNVSAFILNGPRRGLEPIPPFPTEPIPVEMAPPGGTPETADFKLVRKGILGASSIDPEQFIQAKGIVKSILENVNNSDNYRVGDQGSRALREQIRRNK